MTRARPRHLEDLEAMALMAWAERVMYEGKPISYYLTHVPNGGKRNAREAGRLRRMGVKAGYPDYILDVMRPRMRGGFQVVINGAAQIWGGLRLELKAPRETLGRAPATTDLQLEQINRLNCSGYKAVVAEGWLEAAMLICNYLGLDARGLQCASPP